MEVGTIVGYLGGRCKGDSAEQLDWDRRSVSSAVIRERIDACCAELLGFVDRPRDHRRFDEVQRGLRSIVFALARLLLAFFLALREERSEREVRRHLGRGCRVGQRTRKHLNTFFGRVTYWRTEVRSRGGRRVHPLDSALGLTADGFTLLVSTTAARLATLLSYEQVTAIFLYFQSWSPSKTTVEKAVLGLGQHTADWFESAEPPEGDGEVLVVQIDSKATPTATDEELAKRRGKRERGKAPLSPRHRGRQKRRRYGPRKRRKKGDHSKNGRAATICVLYTLRKGRDENGKAQLLGPLNKWVYASYAPKRHVFAVARREADKRGFTARSRKLIHILTDGDEDLERGVKDFFPEARHTLDLMHVLEYFWEAGRFAFAEGSTELTAWVKKQERLLYAGKAALAILNLNGLVTRGAAAEGRLDQIRNYLHKRLRLMNYHELRREDLDVATGAVEGAVRHVIAKRFDSSGMRWIRERAEALLQLRCIEINGQWAAFERFVGERLDAAQRTASPTRLLTNKPAALPSFGVAA
jgi:hypothetical protein